MTQHKSNHEGIIERHHYHQTEKNKKIKLSKIKQNNQQLEIKKIKNRQCHLVLQQPGAEELNHHRIQISVTRNLFSLNNHNLTMQDQNQSPIVKLKTKQFGKSQSQKLF